MHINAGSPQPAVVLSFRTGSCMFRQCSHACHFAMLRWLQKAKLKGLVCMNSPVAKQRSCSTTGIPIVANPAFRFLAALLAEDKCEVTSGILGY